MPEENKKLEIIKQSVFEYVVMKHPTIAEAEEGKGSEIVVAITPICANDPEDAKLQAHNAIPVDLMKFRSRLEVAVRPF